jgi:4-diphosphocytidyl-2-C-methyl-D-erythritol kinase
MLIKSYPKINLYLDVINKREDGYHNILTLFHSIENIYDLIDVEFSEKEDFFCEPNLDFNWENNIIKKTIELFKKETGKNDFNLKIKMRKMIPQGGGLGGGSSNSAAILKFLGENYRVSESDLMKMALKIGSDVSFLIKGGTAIGESRGENLTFLEPLKIKTILKPLFITINTGEMYDLISKNFENLKRKGDPYKLYEALKIKNIEEIKNNSFNIFEQVVFSAYPEIEISKNYFENNSNCIITRMSGSGSTLYGIL